MGQPNTVCADWRWSDDLATRTWLAALHTDLASPDSYLDTNVRLVVLLDNTGSKDEVDGYRLYYRVDGGAWALVAATTQYVRAFSTTHYSDGDSTSQELGSGTFTAGVKDTTGAISSMTLPTGNETEHEFCFQYRSFECPGHTIEVAVRFDGDTDLDGYTYSHPSMVFTDPAELQQSHFRIRDDAYGLNVDNGWQAALDTDVTLDAEKIYNLRIEIEEIGGASKTATLKPQYRYNSGAWTDLIYEPFNSTSSTVPAVHVTLSDQYADGDATTNLLSGSSKTFVAGTGQEDVTWPAITLNNQHTEIQFPIAFHKIYDGPAHLSSGDTFEFRVVESDDTVLGGTYVTPTITVSFGTGLIGGCWPEAPGDNGPWRDGNGNLYALIEATHNTPYNIPMMMKSADGGDTWAEVDGTNRPTSDDLEVIDGRLVGDIIHIFHHSDSTVVFHQFRVSTHGTPDTWLTTDESIATGLTNVDQFGAMEYRSDGTVVAFYSRTDTDERIKYKIRSSGGTWGSENDLDSTASTDFYGIMCVKEAGSDWIHAAYKDHTNHDLYHRSMDPSDDSLTAREALTTDASTEQCPLCTMVAWEDGPDEKVMIAYVQESDLLMKSRIITNDGSPGTEQSASDYQVREDAGGTTSRQPVADIANDGSTVHLLYSDLPSSDLYYDFNASGAGWGTDSEEEDAVLVYYIRSNVFTHSAGNGGAKVLGYIIGYDASGGTGPIYYREITLEDGAFPLPGQRPSPLIRM